MPSLEPEADRSGMGQLAAFSCHQAEEPVLVLRGREDGFSPLGEEPGQLSDRLLGTAFERINAAGYDNLQRDQFFIDHLSVPSDITDGLFVLGLRATARNWNDTLQVGELADAHKLPGAADYEIFSVLVRDMEALEGWSRHGEVYSARLSDMPLQWLDISAEGASLYLPVVDALRGEPRTLLDYIREAGPETVIDIHLVDDTAVDFIGVAGCREPQTHRGLTMGVRPQWRGARDGVVAFSIGSASVGELDGDPYRGDTDCSEALPLLCFQPLEAPAPFELTPPDRTASAAIAAWSGGSVALSRPVRAATLQTLEEANSVCAAQFGEEWRMATFHEGLTGHTFTAFSEPLDPYTRAWVDIRDQPYGVCWRP
ncbi:MAG: hypothetical protein AAFX09_07915 [Pseudomonadota bacterium]